jgi:hypothetical protein
MQARTFLWWKLPNDKYHSKPFYILQSSPTVIYDEDEAEVNEVALNEIMPKGFYSAPVKRNMDWEMTRQLHCTMLKFIDAGNQKIKSILETKYGNGRLSTKCLSLKPNNVSGVIWENATTAIAFDEWTIPKIQTYLFNCQMPLKIQND